MCGIGAGLADTPLAAMADRSAYGEFVRATASNCGDGECVAHGCVAQLTEQCVRYGLGLHYSQVLCVTAHVRAGLATCSSLRHGAHPVVRLRLQYPFEIDSQQCTYGCINIRMMCECLTNRARLTRYRAVCWFVRLSGFSVKMCIARCGVCVRAICFSSCKIAH